LKFVFLTFAAISVERD